MADALAWTGAVGAIVAAVGAWRTEATARWQARVERLRDDKARKENELHRARYVQLYNWWDSLPEGPERTMAARWFSEWTGARDPYRAGQPGPIPPGVGMRDADEGYIRYVDHLAGMFRSGVEMPPIPAPPAPQIEAVPVPEIPKQGQRNSEPASEADKADAR